MSLLSSLYDATVTIAGHPITWREILGNAFGFASAVGGLRRRVWAWPVGIVGNVLLFTVFIAATFEVEAQVPLFGQAGRQVFFILTSVYGWYRWHEQKLARGAGSEQPAITPRWATARERVGYLLAALGAILLCQWLFSVIGAGFPAPRWYFWCDAWIFVGSMLAITRPLYCSSSTVSSSCGVSWCGSGPAGSNVAPNRWRWGHEASGGAARHC
jgi:nicotinamide mononucleotide transporter